MVARAVGLDRWTGEQEAQGADGRNGKTAGAAGRRTKPKVGTDDEPKNVLLTPFLVVYVCNVKR